jgi:recombinational DNA repair ATPase RecF
LAKLAEWRAVARATGERPLFSIDEFDAGLAAGWVETLFSTLPEAETILLSTASDSGRYRRRADHVLEIRGGRASGSAREIANARPQAVNA